MNNLILKIELQDPNLTIDERNKLRKENHINSSEVPDYFYGNYKCRIPKRKNKILENWRYFLAKKMGYIDKRPQIYPTLLDITLDKLTGRNIKPISQFEKDIKDRGLQAESIIKNRLFGLDNNGILNSSYHTLNGCFISQPVYRKYIIDDGTNNNINIGVSPDMHYANLFNIIIPIEIKSKCSYNAIRWSQPTIQSLIQNCIQALSYNSYEGVICRIEFRNNNIWQTEDFTIDMWYIQYDRNFINRFYDTLMLIKKEPMTNIDYEYFKDGFYNIIKVKTLYSSLNREDHLLILLEEFIIF